MIAAEMLIIAFLAGPAPEAKPKPSVEKAPGKPRVVALCDGTIHTIARGTVRHGSILVEEGKILRVGAGIEIPEGAERIELRGRPVLPGLVAATAMGIVPKGSGKAADAADPYAPSLELALAAGITSFHQAGGDGVIFRATPGDPEGLVVAEPAVVPLRWSTREPAGRIEIRENLQRASEYLKALKAYREAKLRGDAKAKPPRKDPRIGPYVDLLEGKRPAWISALRTGEILTALELADAFPIRIVIAGAIEAWAVAPEIARRKRVAVVFAPRARRYPDPRRNAPNGWRIETAAILARAGVPFAIVPQRPYISLGGIAGRDLAALLAEAAFAVRGGLSEDAALEAVTLGPARILGIADRVGSIEAGKDADLIVLSGDPLHYRSYVQLAFVRGKLVFDRAKSRIFRQLPGGGADARRGTPARPPMPCAPPPGAGRRDPGGT